MVEVKNEYYQNEVSYFYMVLQWQHERIYGCNIIFEFPKSNVEMIYTPKYHVIYFLYFVYGAWMWVGASADLVTLEEEYPAWGSF